MLYIKQKTAYDMRTCLEFRRVLFRSRAGHAGVKIYLYGYLGYAQDDLVDPGVSGSCQSESGGSKHRSEERRVGKSVDLGGRRIIKKIKLLCICVTVNRRCIIIYKPVL